MIMVNWKIDIFSTNHVNLDWNLEERMKYQLLNLKGTLKILLRRPHSNLLRLRKFDQKVKALATAYYITLITNITGGSFAESPQRPCRTFGHFK